MRASNRIIHPSEGYVAPRFLGVAICGRQVGRETDGARDASIDGSVIRLVEYIHTVQKLLFDSSHRTSVDLFACVSRHFAVSLSPHLLACLFACVSRCLRVSTCFSLCLRVSPFCCLYLLPSAATLHVGAYNYTDIHNYVCIYIYIYIQIDMCISLSLYIYIYKYIHTLHAYPCRAG